jgi:hypothetical protein
VSVEPASAPSWPPSTLDAQLRLDCLNGEEHDGQGDDGEVRAVA